MPRRFSALVVLEERNPSATIGVLRGIAEYGRRTMGLRIGMYLNRLPARALLEEDLRRYDGIIARLASHFSFEEIKPLGKPVVNLLTPLEDRTLSSVLLDDVEVGRRSAEHMLDRGYVNLAYFGPNIEVSRSREAGFVACARARGASVWSMLEARARLSFDKAMSPSALRDFLSPLPRPLGLMTFNDEVSVAALEACALFGARVPDDIAIVGVDNNVIHCEFSATTLSSVDRDDQRIGETAAELLHGLMRGKTPPGKPVVVQPGSIVVRQSSAAMSFADPDVRQAMHYLRENFADRAMMDEMLGRLCISRRSLERKFKTNVGRSPASEVRRLRLTHACELLASTSRPIAEISEACGFDYLTGFCATFRHFVGSTPGQYRERHQKPVF